MTKLFFSLCFLAYCFCNAQNTLEVQSTENDSLSAEIQGQLKTFKNLRIYLKKKKYDKVISLFTLETQYYLKLIQKDKERFKTWYQAWTYDKATYGKYVEEIKNGGGAYLFDFEDNEWRINQK